MRIRGGGGPTFHFDAVPGPDPGFQIKAQNREKVLIFFHTFWLCHLQMDADLVQLITLMRIRIKRITLMRIRIKLITLRIWIKLITLIADPDQANHSDADPDQAYHFDADPDQAYSFDADPDPQHRL